MNNEIKLLRLPAEWEEQSGVMMTWPASDSDWFERMEQAEKCFAKIAAKITEFENLLLVCEDMKKTLNLLILEGANIEKIKFAEVCSNDVWARDHGPITVESKNENLLLDFGFNGWGLKYRANFDNQITRTLHQKKVFKNSRLQTIDFILEGGSIESDGRGTILTTSNCLLSPNRNPHLSKQEIERVLKDYLGAEKILWLDYGYLAGDDTDLHIDTLARLTPNNSILYVSTEDKDDEHYEELQKMESQLKQFKNNKGEPYQLCRLPLPKIYDEENKRLASSYANFLIVNGAVLVPTYNCSEDKTALETIAKEFPEREVIGLDCLELIRQNGSLHCVTMQLPKGVKF
jgi:agmatine deiminase